MSRWDDISTAHKELAKRELTDKQLRVLRLRIDGQSFGRIGVALGITEATARGHYRAALRRLRPHLTKEAA